MNSNNDTKWKINFPSDFGKGIATVAIWTSVAVICFFAPNQAEHIVGTAGIATVLMWLFS